MSKAKTLIDNGVAPIYHKKQISDLVPGAQKPVSEFVQHVAQNGPDGKGLYLYSQDPERASLTTNVVIRGLLLSGVQACLIPFQGLVASLDDGWDSSYLHEQSVLGVDVVQHIPGQASIYSEREMDTVELFLRMWMNFEKGLVISSTLPPSSDDHWWSAWTLGRFKDRLTAVSV